METNDRSSEVKIDRLSQEKLIKERDRSLEVKHDRLKQETSRWKPLIDHHELESIV
jgi:hypothetical protein